MYPSSFGTVRRNSFDLTNFLYVHQPHLIEELPKPQINSLLVDFLCKPHDADAL